MSTDTETKTTGTDLLPFDARALVALEERCEEYRTAIAVAPPFQRAFLMGQAMKTLREMITAPMLECVKAGEGQALGFKTDRWVKGQRYEDEVVRDITIEATLRGYHMVNNEVNIIAGGFYAAKNGVKRRCTEWPGITGLQVAFAVPEIKGGDALVAARCVYLLDGEERRFDRVLTHLEGGGEFDNRIAIRVNQGQGADAILGKAERKFFASLLEHLSGETVPAGDVDDALDVTSSPGTPPTQSSLFPDEAPAPQGPDPATQDQYVAEYERKLAECSEKSYVGRVAKQAGGDQRLTTESRKQVADLCTAKRKELVG